MSDDDSGTFSIRLVDDDGDPISNRKVTCFYSGGLLPGGSHAEYTDDDGWCEFPTFGNSSVSEIYSYELYGLLVQQRSVLLSDGEDIHDGASFSFTVIDE
jgi:hypothetical protein